MSHLMPAHHKLARDPNTKCRLNANSYQQDTVTTYNGWQYCAYYTSGTDEPDAPRYVTLARRVLSSRTPVHDAANTANSSPHKAVSDTWESFVFHDYTQKTDDGHNTISLGICPGDGTIHLSFDHHCDQLHFRISQLDIATDPSQHIWSTDLFSPVLDTLPGIEGTCLLQQVTYPRFVPAGNLLVFEYRVGMAGEGSDVICHYSPETQSYSQPKVYLQGIGNNPYIHGLSYDQRKSRLHATWTYRQFVEFDRSTDSHKQQSGPNGPENNRDLAYAYSNDLGLTWHNSDADIVGDTNTPIRPEAPGIIVYTIPRNSGILNQEGQTVDVDGNVHVLMRDTTRTDVHEWRHITRSASSGVWSTKEIPGFRPTAMGLRGCVCSDPRTGSVYLLLPGNEDGDDSLSLLKRGRSFTRDTLNSKGDSSQIETELLEDFELLWEGNGYSGEPSYDEHLLRSGSGILSVFTRTSGPEKWVVLLDLEL